MRYAPIAAPQWARHYQRGSYHMVIAPWVLKHGGLGQYYSEAMRDAGTWVMMDNGSWEGFDLSVEELIRAGVIITADEVVLPDVLHEPKHTLLASRDAYSRLAEEAWPTETGTYQMGPRSVMFVPQGRTADIWRRCRDHWLGWWTKEMRACNLCIGINSPRSVDISRKRSELIQDTVDLGFQVHLLGIPDLQQFVHVELPLARAQGVRGVDSSLPFTLGALGLLMTPASSKFPLQTPDNYERLTANNRRLIYLNIAIMRDWIANGSHTWLIPWELVYSVATMGAGPEDTSQIYRSPQLALRRAGFPNGTYRTDGTTVNPVLPAGEVAGQQDHIEVRHAV